LNLSITVNIVYIVNFRHFKLILKVKFMKIDDLNFFKTIMEKYTSNKTKVLSSLNKLKNILASESQETTEMLEVYRKYAAGEEVDKIAMDKANNQFTDLIKNVGLIGVFALPGGMVAIPLLVKLGKKLGIDILPKSYRD